MAEGPGTWPREAVIDTCLAAAWVFNEPHTAVALPVYASVAAGAIQAFVPALFWAEFQQVCAKKLRPPSGQIAPLAQVDVETALAVLESTPLTEIPDVLTTYRDRVRELVMDTTLNAYDAYFAAMASDLGLPILTLDAGFREAAEAVPSLAGIVHLVWGARGSPASP